MRALSYQICYCKKLYSALIHCQSAQATEPRSVAAVVFREVSNETLQKSPIGTHKKQDDGECI